MQFILPKCLIISSIHIKNVKITVSVIIYRYHFPDIEMRSPELKPRRGVGRRGVPGHCAGQQRGPLGGKEDENQAWLAMLEKATNSVRYISRHIKKEHFIREVGVTIHERRCGDVHACYITLPFFFYRFLKLIFLKFSDLKMTQSSLCAPNDGRTAMKCLDLTQTHSFVLWCFCVSLCFIRLYKIGNLWLRCWTGFSCGPSSQCQYWELFLSSPQLCRCTSAHLHEGMHSNSQILPQQLLLSSLSLTMIY